MRTEDQIITFAVLDFSWGVSGPDLLVKNLKREVAVAVEDQAHFDVDSCFSRGLEVVAGTRPQRAGSPKPRAEVMSRPLRCQDLIEMAPAMTLAVIPPRIRAAWAGKLDLRYYLNPFGRTTWQMRIASTYSS